MGNYNFFNVCYVSSVEFRCFKAVQDKVECL